MSGDNGEQVYISWLYNIYISMQKMHVFGRVARALANSKIIVVLYPYPLNVS